MLKLRSTWERQITDDLMGHNKLINQRILIGFWDPNLICGIEQRWVCLKGTVLPRVLYE